MLRMIINAHGRAILNVFQFQLQRGPTRNVFSSEGKVVLDSHGSYLCFACAKGLSDLLDVRIGRTHLRDTGDLAAASRGPPFAIVSDRLNNNPTMLLEVFVRLRFDRSRNNGQAHTKTILDLIEQKANYPALQAFRHRNFSKEEITKLGPLARGTMYIKLAHFPSHYLVLVIIEEDFRYSLISRPPEVVIDPRAEDPRVGQKRKRDVGSLTHNALRRDDNFNLETQTLRELYAYSLSVAYTKVEAQFKLRGIPYTHVSLTSALSIIHPLAYTIFPSKFRSHPLCSIIRHPFWRSGS
ncbi:hypothetical protein JVU11DRAFT_7217 [Chiua virens]|nr:hypothetical protein JVU11DRAFT_7217 [Chiua virens]